MKQQILELQKITNCKWLNLFRVKFLNSKKKVIEWVFASRKENPLKNDDADAVVIVPIINTPEGKKIVIIKEYRIAIGGYEYGFPAGLVEDGLSLEETAIKELKEETGLEVKGIIKKSNKIYSSPGLSDESCVVVFVEAEGSLSEEFQEEAEDIEVIPMGIKKVINLMADPNKKIGTKAWGVLYYYSQIGEIR